MQDLDLPPEMVAEARTAPGEDSQFVAPRPGVTPTQRWLQKCSLAADHVAAGDFASAMRLLNR
jgi:coatomer protein complex subunit alpha (xenin)